MEMDPVYPQDLTVIIDFAKDTPHPNDVFEGILNVIDDPEKLECLQQISKSVYHATVSTHDLVDRLTSRGVRIGRRCYYVYSADDNAVWVKVKNFPHQYPDELIRKEIAKYGVVKSVVICETWSNGFPHCFNGTRKLRVVLERDIPEVLRFGRHTVKVFYEGMQRRCFLCRGHDHLKADCPVSAEGNPANVMEELRPPLSSTPQPSVHEEEAFDDEPYQTLLTSPTEKEEDKEHTPDQTLLTSPSKAAPPKKKKKPKILRDDAPVIKEVLQTNEGSENDEVFSYDGDPQAETSDKNSAAFIPTAEPVIASASIPLRKKKKLKN